MLEPSRTFAIICGASSFPHLPDFDSWAAFKNSATEIRRYLSDRAGAALPDSNILWLFDEPNSTSHYDSIDRFLEEHLTGTNAPDGDGCLLLFFYVGHGALLGRQQEYCLLVKDTRRPSEVDTSLRVSTLMSVLRNRAPRSSLVLILDACFAALAANYVQSGVQQTASAEARKLVNEYTGDRGMAIAAAASKWKPARVADPSTYTMFNQALMAVLWRGDPETSGPLSLRRIVNLTHANLVAGSLKDPPRPELHVPDQTGGDLGAWPMFPNRAQ